MAIVVLCVGAFLTLLGIAGYIHGMDLLPTERGMAGVISASIVLVGGVLTLGLGLILRRLEDMSGILPQARVEPAMPISAPSPVAPAPAADRPTAKPAATDDLAAPAEIAEKPALTIRPHIQPQTVLAGVGGALAGATAMAATAAATAPAREPDPDLLPSRDVGSDPLPEASLLESSTAASSRLNPLPDVAASAPPLDITRKPITLPKLDFSLKRDLGKAAPLTGAKSASDEDAEYPLEVLTPIDDDRAPMATAPTPPPRDDVARTPTVLVPQMPPATDLGLSEFEAEFEKLMQEPVDKEPVDSQPTAQDSETRPVAIAEPESAEPEPAMAERFATVPAPPSFVGMEETALDEPSPSDADLDAAASLPAAPDLSRITLPPVTPLIVDKPLPPVAAETDVAELAAQESTPESPAPELSAQESSAQEFPAVEGPSLDDRRQLDALLSEPAGAGQAPAGTVIDLAPAPSPAALKPQPAPGAEIVGAYESGGAKYTMYSDGSVIAEANGETLFFKSLEELRDFIDSGPKT